MGSTGSQSSQTDLTAKWNSERKCHCGNNCWYVIKIIWKSVPMAGSIAVEFSRTTIELLTKRQPFIKEPTSKEKANYLEYSHDCIEFLIQCYECGSKFYETM